MPADNSLGKNERLKSRKTIELLFKKGNTFNVSFIRAYYLLSSSGNEQGRHAPLRMGVGVTTRNFRKATDRNRIKRLHREGWRIQKKSLIDLLVSKEKQVSVFLVFTGREIPAYSMVNEKIKLVIKKLSEKIHEDISADS